MPARPTARFDLDCRPPLSVVDTVREIFCNVAHIDFQQVGDLERFFTLAAGRHRRRSFKTSRGIELRAPRRAESAQLRGTERALRRLHPIFCK